MSPEAPVSGTKSLIIANLQRAVDQATKGREWVVVVYPSSDKAEEARTLLSALVPKGSTAGGRTALLPRGGRISIVTALEKPFETEEKLAIMFAGWDNADDKAYTGMNAWRGKSSRVLNAEDVRA